MTDAKEREGQGSSPEQKSGWRDLAVAVFLGEVAALLIAAIMPITPSKVGSTWSPAELFWTAPSYLQQVAAYFAMLNLIMTSIGLVIGAHLALDRSTGSRGSRGR